jgi:neutral ceramidase
MEGDILTDNINLVSGISRADISPGLGLQLQGYPHCLRHNTGIHDPLYATCIYIGRGDTKIAIVALDLSNYPKKYIKNIRKKISRHTDIPGGNVMICCSHTHSGPATKLRANLDDYDKDIPPDGQYLEEVERKIISTIIDAGNNSFEARIGIGKGHCGKEKNIGGNRNDPDGVCDPDVYVLGISDKEGRLRSCLVKYSLHPTLLHSESTLVSADYPAYLKSYIEKNKPGSIALFAQGISGNQSTRYFRNGQTFEDAERVGETIAMEALDVLDKVEYMDDLELSVDSIEVELEIRDLPPKETAEERVRSAKRKLEQIKSDDSDYIDIRNAELRLLGAENILCYTTLLENNAVEQLNLDELPAEIQLFGIGDARIVGIQGELFTEYGLDIISGSPFENTILIGLANGILPGYLCTEEAYKDNTYEAGASLLTPESGRIILKEALRLLRKSSRGK